MTKKEASSTMVGESVPNFSRPSTSGADMDLKDLRGKYVVLYFYPKDATPGCTIQGLDFTRLHKKFKALNAEIFGISRDNLKSHIKFKEKQKYSIDLLSDEDESLCTAFDVMKIKNMYGIKRRGVERSTFVISPSGKLLKEWRGVKVPGHAEEVLEYIKSL